MKRTLLLMWLTMATVCASAQYKSVITVSEDEMDEPHRASYNLTSVCKSLGYGREDLGHILEVWLDPNRTWKWKDEYRQYENLPLMYLLSGGEKTLGQPHGAFGLMADGSPWTETDEIPPRMEDMEVLIEADPGQNQLNFSLYLMPDPVTGQTALKAGDVFHATFGLEYEGREATFDLTLNIVKGTGGNDVSLRDLEKVGEESVKLKYKEGKPCKAVLDLASIASHFGGDVEAGNLQLYVARKGEPGVLSDRCAYSETPTVTCDEEMAENPDYQALRNVFFSYYPLPQEIHAKPTGGFAAGEHATGPLYLVAEGKYYALLMDVQFGDGDDLMPTDRPFAENGKAWKMGWFDEADTTDMLTAHSLEWHSLDGDTLIAGRQCRKMMCRTMDGASEAARYMGAIYEFYHVVYLALPGTTDFLLLYDFTLETGESMTLYDIFRGASRSYTIGAKTVEENLQHRGIRTEIMDGSSLESEWIEGVGCLGAYKVASSCRRNGKVLRLMECMVGDEVLYCNSSLHDGVTPDQTEAKKKRLDFTHIIKSQPKVPRRLAESAANDSEQTLTGTYSSQMLQVDMSPLTGTYVVTLTDDEADTLYVKESQTNHILALQVDLSRYSAGNYTLTLANDWESYTAVFTLEGLGLSPIPSPIENRADAMYDLQGRRLSSPPRRGLYIQGGRLRIIK